MTKTLFQKTLNSLEKKDFKYIVNIFETVLDTDEEVANALGITVKQVKKYSQREKIQLDGLLKRLFQCSPILFLGTIDYLYKTNYYNEYVNGDLTNEDISFEGGEFIRETFLFEIIRADSIIKIKDSIYQIEFQTSNDNMAIRLLRYGIEYGIHNKKITKEGLLQITIPEQSVIFLEENKSNPNSNSYELIWQNNSLGIIEVKTLKLWELELEEALENKLYNLVPILIFKYRSLLNNAKSQEEIDALKQSLLEQTRIILEKFYNPISDQIPYDINLLICVLGDLISYFDTVYFEHSIEKVGEFTMTFTKFIQDLKEEFAAEKEAQLKKLTAEKEAQLKKLTAEKDTQLKKLTAEKEAQLKKLTAEKDTQLFNAAKNLLAMGMDFDLVASTMNLPIETVKSISLN